MTKTPEPWTVVTGRVTLFGDALPPLVKCGKHTVATVEGDERLYDPEDDDTDPKAMQARDEARARRIVACVNALAGVSAADVELLANDPSILADLIAGYKAASADDDAEMVDLSEEPRPPQPMRSA